MDTGDESGLPADWVVPGYHHERRIGSGGSGRVMLARHDGTGTPVAIKYLIPALHSAEDFRAGYRAEAVLLGELRSPHVTRLYEYVEGEHGAAIVMELVEGASLRALLRAEGATSPEAALVVLKGSLLGLAAAHEVGVVHRDYKPENVLVTAQGVSKLVDFGIAARSGEVPQAAGTPVYMAPELFAGRPATPAADVYAATATFFECITGARPYSGTTVMELMIQHTQGRIPDELAPEEVRPLIRAGLAKDPEQRPASAAAFVGELEDVARAAYGEDWEERGQHKLAALIAMLPLLLLKAPPQTASGTTALAVTDLGPGAGAGLGAGARLAGRIGGRPAKAALGLTAALVVAGGIAAVTGAANASTGAGNAGAGATSHAVTSLAPTQGAELSVSPSASGTAPSASASASPSPSVAAAQMTPSKGAASPSVKASTSAQPTATATSSAPALTPLRVTSVSITSSGCSGSTGFQATVDVVSNGAATGKLELTWYYTLVSGGARTPVANDAVTLPKGKTEVSNTYSHVMGSGVYWGVAVSTVPAAATGQGSTATVLVARCAIQ